MEFEIDEIHVTAADGGMKPEVEEIARDVQRHILEAVEQLSRSGPAAGCENVECLNLDLPEIDWDAEPDKTGKILRLLSEAIEEIS